ncbi:hypothetical protein [Nocardia sp. IFM 10818]
MRITAGIFGLVVAIAGAVMMCLGFMAQKDLRDDSARTAMTLGWMCQADKDIPTMEECTWGRWDGSRSTPGEDTLPVRERTGELISNVVLIGAALFVGGLVLTGGALAAGRRPETAMPAASQPQMHHSAAQWS